MGLPSPKKLINRFNAKENIGVDIIHYAALAGVFGLNLDDVMYNDLELLYDQGEFVPEHYGIFRKSNKPFQLEVTSEERAISKPYHTSVKKRYFKMLYTIKKSEPVEMINLFATLQDNQQ